MAPFVRALSAFLLGSKTACIKLSVLHFFRIPAALQSQLTPSVGSAMRMDWMPGVDCDWDHWDVVILAHEEMWSITTDQGVLKHQLSATTANGCGLRVALRWAAEVIRQVMSLVKMPSKNAVWCWFLVFWPCTRGATLATLNDFVGLGKNKHIVLMVHNEIPKLCGKERGVCLDPCRS